MMKIEVAIDHIGANGSLAFEKNLNEIKKRLKNEFVPLTELPNVLRYYKAFCPVCYDENGNFKSQQLFCLDITNRETPYLSEREAIDRLKQYGIHTAFVSRRPPQVYRLFVVVHGPVQDEEEAKQAREGLVFALGHKAHAIDGHSVDAKNVFHCWTDKNEIIAADDEWLTGITKLTYLAKNPPLFDFGYQEEPPPFVIEELDKKGNVTKQKISPPDLTRYINEKEHYIFIRDEKKSDGNIFLYVDGCYRLVSKIDIMRNIIKHIESYDYKLVKTSTVNETFDYLTRKAEPLPSKILNQNESLISFKDGILNIETLEFVPHNPKYLITRQIPIEWEGSENATAPVFHKYMAYLCGGVNNISLLDEAGQAKYKLLMQFLGACISNVKGYRYKKALFLYGDGDTGKSQLKSLAEYLVGEENCCPCDLSQLESRFGTSTIYNKRLIGSADMPYTTIKELSTFKNVTGGDTLFAEYKGENGFDFRFDGFVWFCMNRLPRFGGDNGDWVYNRFIPVECSYVVPEEKRDRRLLDKMKQEAVAITREALLCYREIYLQDKPFAEPESVKQARNAYKQDNDSVTAFIADCCIVSKGERSQLTTRRVYAIYKQWCNDYENGYCLKEKDFRQEIIRRFGAVVHTEKGNRYCNFILKDEFTVFN